MVCSLHRTSPAADGLQPSPHQSSHDSLRSSPQQSSRSSLQPSWHQSSRAIADPVQPPSFCLVFLSLMLLDYIYIYMINVINLGYITVAIIFPNAFKYALLKSGPSRYFIRTENCWHLSLYCFKNLNSTLFESF